MTAERRKRLFFHVDDRGRVSLVQGHECEGSDYWWCPQIGVSAAEGSHLFRDRNDAYAKGHAVASANLARAKADLADIERERYA